jgi:hypothetical protein
MQSALLKSIPFHETESQYKLVVQFTFSSETSIYCHLCVLIIYMQGQKIHVITSSTCTMGTTCTGSKRLANLPKKQ